MARISVTFREMFFDRRTLLMAIGAAFRNYWFVASFILGAQVYILWRLPMFCQFIVFFSFFFGGFALYLAFRLFALRSRLRNDAQTFAQYKAMSETERRSYFRLWM